MTEVTLFPEQLVGKQKFEEWFNNGEPRSEIFRIFGYAGTGKTTITKEIIKGVKGTVMFGAYTGKAALVMQRHGLPANTVHSLIYRPIVPDKQAADDIRAEIKELQDNGVLHNSDEMQALYKELKEASSLVFELNDESPLNTASLFVLDECSMIDDEMKGDILSFGIPLLVLGDPGQLPPIRGTGALTRDMPDVLLEEIHRQALDNPIIELSFKARTGEIIALGDYGESKKISKQGFTAEVALQCDQILTGKNVTRRALNQRARKELGRLEEPYPVLGDKVICLRNNKKLQLFNGLICEVVEKLDEFDVSIEYKLKSEDGRDIICRMLRAHFDEYKTPGTIKSLRWWDFQEAEEFDYGYAITVHKAQGSQWDNVVLYDDGMLSWKDIERRKWLYTAITRASETITLVS